MESDTSKNGLDYQILNPFLVKKLFTLSWIMHLVLTFCPKEELVLLSTKNKHNRYNRPLDI